MKNFLPLLALLFCFSASAADRITATISVTNAPLGNTNSLTINGVTRLFTNTVTASPATLIQQTNSIPWTATNVLNQLTDYRASQFHFLSSSASTNARITGAVGEALTVTLAGGWGAISYSTQTVSRPTYIVRVPMTVEQTSNRTHIASLLVTGQSDNSTNSFATNAVAMSNYLTRGASALQEVIAPALFSGGLRGGNVRLTNGFTSALTNINSVSSNHVNFGNAIRSEGSGGNSLQVGSNALSVGSLSIAIGNGSVASNTSAFAVGISALATNSYSMALGNGAIAGGTDALAIGINHIHVAGEHQPAFLREILGLAGGGHHAAIGIFDAHVASGRHHTRTVVGLLGIGFNRHQARVWGCSWLGRQRCGWLCQLGRTRVRNRQSQETQHCGHRQGATTLAGSGKQRRAQGRRPA